jgi:hypothetical protein
MRLQACCEDVLKESTRLLCRYTSMLGFFRSASETVLPSPVLLDSRSDDTGGPPPVRQEGHPR